mgnify:CR=1 FL=1
MAACLNGRERIKAIYCTVVLGIAGIASFSNKISRHIFLYMPMDAFHNVEK